METNENTPVPKPISQEEMLQMIMEQTRKTNTYMKWQFYITIILVVLPLLAMLFVVPWAFKTLSTTYGGLLQ